MVPGDAEGVLILWTLGVYIYIYSNIYIYILCIYIYLLYIYIIISLYLYLHVFIYYTPCRHWQPPWRMWMKMRCLIQCRNQLHNSKAFQTCLCCKWRLCRLCLEIRANKNCKGEEWFIWFHNRSQGCEVDCHENLTTCTVHVAYSVCLFKGWDIHVFDIYPPRNISHLKIGRKPKGKWSSNHQISDVILIQGGYIGTWMDIWTWWFVISRFFGVVESLQSTRGFEMHVISRRTGKMIEGSLNRNFRQYGQLKSRVE